MTKKRKIFIETYGCQMNVADSEVVAAILLQKGYELTNSLPEAELILLNTCSIRENAEQKIRNRLKQFKQYKNNGKGPVIGVIGCMAERIKDKLLEEERIVDLIAGPDSYRDLPGLINWQNQDKKARTRYFQLKKPMPTFPRSEPMKTGCLHLYPSCGAAITCVHIV